MQSNPDRVIGEFAARWVRWSAAHPISIVVAFSIAMLACAGYTAGRLGINTDTEDMISDRVGWRQDFIEFRSMFPGRYNVIVIVIDANRPAAAHNAAISLHEALLDNPATISAAVRPGGGAFFERNGLLYLDAAELQALADRLTAAQPLLGRMTRDFSFAQLVESLDEALRRGDTEDVVSLAPILSGLADATAAVAGDQPYEMDWAELMGAGAHSGGAAREVIIVKPNLEFSSMQPAAPAIRDIRNAAANLPRAVGDTVTVRLTGTVAMEHEELLSVSEGAWTAGILAFTTVTLVLYVALGSLLTLVAAIITLLFGLAATAAFASVAVGSLNLISVAFGILYIGLAIDFIIHLTLRTREIMRSGRILSDALPNAARDVGSSLTLCAVTTSAGFYAFIPTPFDGVSQLGLIAGTGMYISLFTTLTLLPALLTVINQRVPLAQGHDAGFNLDLLRPVLRHRRAVLIVSCVAAALSIAAIDRVRFDSDPVNLRDPDSESVRTYRELANEADAGSGTLVALAPDQARTIALMRRLESLPSVRSADSILDLVPAQQAEKLVIIDDLSLALGPGLRRVGQLDSPDVARSDNALRALRDSTLEFDGAAELDSVLGRLATGIDEWFALADAERATAHEMRFAALQRAVLGGLPEQLERLERLLTAEPVDADALPAEIRERWISADGPWLVEIHPADEALSDDGVSGFVAQVRAVAPRVTGLTIVQHAAKDTVVESFRLAFLYALIIVVIVLGIFLRNTVNVLLVLGPILLAAVVTLGTMVLIGMSLNFANIIALPLLLGIGVDNGIHMVHRMKISPPADGNILHTSTSRAVLFSSLTTMCSFGSLAFSPHIGMASMGALLSLGLFASLLATLVLLPVLLERADQR